MFAGGWDTIDDGHGIQRQRNDVVISNDTRKQQLTTRNLSLFLLVLARYYITERDHGLRLLVCIVVMVSESIRHGGRLQKMAGHGVCIAPKTATTRDN
jgi:hypothetical protein